MNFLVSLPRHASKYFHQLSNKPEKSWFCTADPDGSQVGSGGGSAWLLSEAWKNSSDNESFKHWLKSDSRALIHGGGQSRRLPAYGPVGKLHIPIPVYRWQRGQRLNQTLLDLQTPLLERLLTAAPSGTHTLLASGDALILSNHTLEDLPDADVISFGIPVDPALAANHGVFICDRKQPTSLKFMLQKPSQQTLRDLATDYLFYIDIGIWLLSDRAVEIIMKRSGWDADKQLYTGGVPDYYDFYGDFGLGLGKNPTQIDDEINSLSSAIVRIPDGEFYHFGTNREIISSSLALQNKVQDQESIWSRNVKPHPAMFVQNTELSIPLKPEQKELWIENSVIGKGWYLQGSHVITGVPQNDWKLDLPRNLCLDVVPIPGVSGNSRSWVLRPYGMHDAFRGVVSNSTTQWMHQSIVQWFEHRGIALQNAGISVDDDIQDAKIFPVLDDIETCGKLISWMVGNEINSEMGLLWLNARRVSAADLLVIADIPALDKQRKKLRLAGYKALRNNYRRSVFYQIDLDAVAQEMAGAEEIIPEALPDSADPLLKMHDAMFLSRFCEYQVQTIQNEKYAKMYEQKAFSILQQSILEPFRNNKVLPILGVYEDQIVWGRSPVRIDLAGGWTDTPPHSILEGGEVVTIGLELNGQPPLQAFIRPSAERRITLRSIDLGARELVHSYEELEGYDQPGSPFSIPKAALCLAGFHPDFSAQQWDSLESQLDAFGSGLEISFLAAIPKGSGMGTSSILAGTILGALSDFCSLNWDRTEICNRTLALEQLLTTGGGWQDQYGGILPGVKLLSTRRGFDQTPQVRWLPDMLFTQPEFRDSMLLYYTGITRIAKNLLSEIVQGMFLNAHDRSAVLRDMKIHARETAEVIQGGNYTALGRKIAKSWELNNLLDSDTNNTGVQRVINEIDDLSIGYKLPGAGGGGYLFILAKDPDAARVIRARLKENPPNRRARFVDMAISQLGMQVSRS